MNKQIFITDFDLKRFRWLISNGSKFDNNYINALTKLELMLKSALIIPPQEIPPNVITMNSKFRIKNLSSGESITCTLVFPFDSDVTQNKISITDELGLSLIGSQSGSILKVIKNNENIEYKIEEILYQPEANGNYYI